MEKYLFKVTDKQDGKVYMASTDGKDFNQAYDNIVELYCYELDCWEDNLTIEFMTKNPVDS